MIEDNNALTIDEQDLLDIQYRRRTVVDAILAGNILDLNPALLSIALRAMADIDKTVKNKRSAKQATEDGDKLLENNALLTKILLTHKTQTTEPVERDLVELPPISLDLVPGETD